MTCPTTTILLHVADPLASAEFYRRILESEPVSADQDFVLFALSPGNALGLWRRDRIDPPATGVTDSIEIGFKQSHDGVDACHADWVAQGVTILMPPSDRPFGRSFVALDPDGHRLRVYALKG
ncbi:VOC family protein [Sphingomonas fuzhouensis]|uniref:VOC family protein n=1 Tax=Sphingomonas fuzhouensis TaxID=3106033 RepID=UPI002AFE0BA8|nr:VOC family protein [Sphingomonas sp. SGZ-02]